MTARSRGLYAGAGLYSSMHTAAEIDPALAAIFASPTPIYVPNTSFNMSNDTEGQFGMAITGGYRARFALPGGGTGFTSDPGIGNRATEGIYVGANYHYLHGFDYEHLEPSARLDTDTRGLLTVNLAKGLPVVIPRTTSGSGTGFAIDAGAAAVVGPWEFGLGVNGIANRIDWKDVERTNYVLDSLFSGGEFIDLPTVPVGDVRVELPVDVRANAAYDPGAWTAIGEYGHGYNGTTFRGGYEYRLPAIQLRGGGRYVKERWEPTGGARSSPSPSTSASMSDCYSTSANLERQRHLGIAVSLRFIH